MALREEGMALRAEATPWVPRLATIAAMTEQTPDARDAEARLHDNPELVARIEDAEAHPERRVPRPERPR